MKRKRSERRGEEIGEEEEGKEKEKKGSGKRREIIAHFGREVKAS